MSIRCYDSDDAVKYGVTKAVLLYNIRFWIERNRANDKHKYTKNGVTYYWTYNSAKAFSVLFPEFSAKKIGKCLRELEKDGVIISGNFNTARYDQTKWYALYEITTKNPPDDILYIHCPKKDNQLSPEGQPIPDINTDINILSPRTARRGVLATKKTNEMFGYNEKRSSDDYEDSIDFDTGEKKESPGDVKRWNYKKFVDRKSTIQSLEDSPNEIDNILGLYFSVKKQEIPNIASFVVLNKRFTPTARKIYNIIKDDESNGLDRIYRAMQKTKELYPEKWTLDTVVLPLISLKK